ncbi:potassium-transporting ATPase [Mycolicibacterium sp. S3B2]
MTTLMSAAGYLALTVAIFALFGLVQKAPEKLEKL